VLIKIGAKKDKSILTLLHCVLRSSAGTASALLFVLAVTFFSSGRAVAGNGPALTGLVARADDASTAFFNPAGLMRVADNQIVGQPTIVYTQSKFKVQPGSTFAGGNAKSDKDGAVIPSFYWSKPLGESFRFGLTVNVPSGVGNAYGKTWSGRYQAEKSTMAFVAITPVIAYRVNEHLSIGGGPSVIIMDSKQTVAVNNVLDGQADGKMKLDESGAAVGWTVSGLWEFNDHARFGLTYRSEAEPDVDGVPELIDVGQLRLQALAAAGLLAQKIKVDFRVPQMVFAGYYMDLSPKWSVSTDFIWADMSEFGIEKLSVGTASINGSSKFKDVYFGSAGLFYQWSEKWRVSIGANYGSEGANDEDRVLQIPLDEVWGVGFGMERSFGERHKFHFNLNYMDLGDASVDQSSTPLAGRVVGEFDTHNLIGLELGITTSFK
jgi:long-chain fatty acid transport protein